MKADASTERGADLPHAARYRQRTSDPLARQFFGRGELLGLSVAILVVFVLLFPRAMIDRELAGQQRVDAASIAYLTQLVHRQPQAVQLRVQLAQQALRAGEVDRAEQALAPLASDARARDAKVARAWIELRQLQVATMKPDDPERAQALQRYARALWNLSAMLDVHAQLAAARAARDAGLYTDAARIAERLLQTTVADDAWTSATAVRAMPPSARDFAARVHNSLHRIVGLVWAGPGVYTELPMVPLASQPAMATALRAQAFVLLLHSWLAADRPALAAAAAARWLNTLPASTVDWPYLVRVASWGKRPDLAADFAERWLRSSPPDARWPAFTALVGTHLAAGESAQALAVAQANLSRMPADTRLWRYMTRLALQANQTKLAAEYAQRMLWPGMSHAH